MDFGGHLRQRGWYANNPTLQNEDAVNAGSSSFFETRLRLAGRVSLAEGVQLNTRFDALEQKVSAARDVYDPADSSRYGKVDEENIQWEVANVTFKALYGSWLVGYTNAPLGYGTKYWESGEGIKPVIRYTVPVGPIEVRATLERVSEWSLKPINANAPAAANIGVGPDADKTIYALAGRYRAKTLEAGLQWQYLVDDSALTRPVRNTTGYTARLHAFQPYFSTKMGPLYIEAEGLYITGKSEESDVPGRTDIDASGYGGFVQAVYTQGPLRLGASVSYTSGDDPATTDKREGNFVGGGSYFDGSSSQTGSSALRPMLMMFNTTFGNMFGNFGASTLTNPNDRGPNNINGTQGDSNRLGANNDNCWEYSVYGNYTFTPKFDVYAAFAWRKADEKPANRNGVRFVDDEIGKELNVTLQYKLTDQLSYQVVGAYFWTGDYFKGANAAQQIDDNYVVMHFLDLEF
jgi:hypothetical protein